MKAGPCVRAPLQFEFDDYDYYIAGDIPIRRPSCSSIDVAEGTDHKDHVPLATGPRIVAVAGMRYGERGSAPMPNSLEE